MSRLISLAIIAAGLGTPYLVVRENSGIPPEPADDQRVRSTLTREPPITIPPEWAPQAAIWTAWPADPDEWNGDLESPRRDVAALVRALMGAGNRVRLLVNGDEAEATDVGFVVHHEDLHVLASAFTATTSGAPGKKITNSAPPATPTAIS